MSYHTSLQSSTGGAQQLPAIGRHNSISAQSQTSIYSRQSSGTTNTGTTDSSGQSSSNNQSSFTQYKSLAHALVPDLPLLMHGSGDVLPEEVDPLSVATIAQLTEKYVASLVSAAMDAHDVFTDGDVVGGGACLGPPPFNARGGEDGDDINDGKKRKAKEKTSRRKKKKKIDYWDVPLPPPGQDTNDGDSSIDSEISDDESDDNAPMFMQFRRMSSSSSFHGETLSSLQGFAPVDLHANQRTRSFYVTAPSVMDARSFIFPICHDPVLYQRIKEVQASRRATRRDVVDNVLMEMMKEEGANEGRRGMVDTFDAVYGGTAINGGASAYTAKAMGEDKAKGVNKKKYEGKSDNGANIVGAGLLDSDVNASWPGLNSLSRGGLW